MSSTISPRFSASRALPPQPNLEHLRNEAKRRLQTLREGSSAAQLSDAQFQLAREYGFSSWRDLKSEVDRRTAGTGGASIGDWIAEIAGETRVALHIRSDAAGQLEATLDARTFGRFGMPLDDFSFDGERISFAWSTPSPHGIVSAHYEGQLDKAADVLVGVWKVQGISVPLSFLRGTYPPAPSIEGLDGIWDGRFPSRDAARIMFRIRTDAHGTFAWCDSPDRNLFEMPASIARDDRRVTLRMKTASVEGQLSSDGGKIEGHFQRGENRVPLVLTRREPGGAAPEAKGPAEIELGPDVLARYAGRYEYEFDGPTAITFEDGKLFAQTVGQIKLELAATSETKFRLRAMEATLTFELGDGRVKGFVVNLRGRISRAKRIE